MLPWGGVGSGGGGGGQNVLAYRDGLTTSCFFLQTFV